jgi:hypothetical protein
MATRAAALLTTAGLIFGLAPATTANPDLGSGDSGSSGPAGGPTVSRAVAFDLSPPLSEMTVIPPPSGPTTEIPDPGPVPSDEGHTADPVVQTSAGEGMPAPVLTFEGIPNVSNVSPPDPVGDVGLRHYVEMVNLSFAIFNKKGNMLFGPAALGTLWQGFEVSDCEDNSGDPIALYDEMANRWLLSQFTTEGPEFFNCVALSTTSNPLGSYFRYAFSTGENFPDYPKYGVWPDAYYITTREFGPDDSYEGVGIYAVNRQQMLNGVSDPQQVKFFLDRTPPWLPGDGLLPADLDGNLLPPANSPEYLVGSMDNGGPYGAPFDGLNFFEMKVNWSRPARSTFALTDQLPIAPFDTIFPCVPATRLCIPQPVVPNRIDHLGYRQRPIWRLAYRNFGTHESLVTNQSVEARLAVSGVRWWEIRNPQDPVLYQEGTYAPEDGVHRWMGSIATDEDGNMALGFSVSNEINVFPGIRYAGRLAGDPLGTMAQGEAVLVNGSGSQLTSQRWGDYTSMNVDPTDDCTFWYVNEYYTTFSNRWQTRIGAFRFPGCS